jgi:serine/threonine protein kinase
MRTSPVAIGKTIADQFVLESEAGSGGMGTVYRGRALRGGGSVAVKLLHYNASGSEAERFVREAQILAELRHPGIVSYVAHGCTPDGIPYMVMEWLDGEDLAKILRRQRLSVADSLRLMRSVAEALDTAHRRGVVHRDIKPSEAAGSRARR